MGPGVALPAGGRWPRAAAGRGPWLGGYQQLRQHLVRDAHCLAALQALCQAGCQLVLALLTHKSFVRGQQCRICCAVAVLSTNSKTPSASRALFHLLAGVGQHHTSSQTSCKGKGAPGCGLGPRLGRGRRGRCRSGWERLCTDQQDGCLAPANSTA